MPTPMQSDVEEELKKLVAEQKDFIAELRGAIAELRARVREREAAQIELRAENERLTKELGECQGGFETGTKAIEENRQLRAALENCERECEHCAPIARAALTNGEKE